MKKYNLINNLLGWICFAIAAVTYLLTIEPTTSFWDCPEFTAQGAKLEVGHPPGNPIFMLTARFFVTIFGSEISNAAIAVNSMSALLSAATILLLFWTITHLAKKLLVRDDAREISPVKLITIMAAGVCGALAYTWSDTFWFSAVESEVYAFSSFCTALVFWLILKWENRADEPHSDRYLVLIAYVIGVSIAVHLLNLLCIPAIVLVYYYRKHKEANVKGSLIALGISFVIVAAILYGLVPGFIKVAQGFELFCVNTLGMGYNSGVLIYAIVLVAVFIWSIYTLYKGKNPTMIKLSVLLVGILSGLTFITHSGWVWCALICALALYLFVFCKQVPQRVFNVIVLSIFVIFIGYSSYALLLIRASAYTPMNQNAPDNVFALSSYLNREQYGQRPLFYGPVFAETVNRTSDGRNDYVQVDRNGLPVTVPLGISDALYYRIVTGPNGQETYAPIDNGKPGYAKVAKTNPDQPDQYVQELWTPDYVYSPGLNTLFTRIYSMDSKDIAAYKGWIGYENPDIENVLTAPVQLRQQWAEQGWAPFYQIAPYLHNLDYIPLIEDLDDEKVPVWKASMLDNIRYFMNYQLNHMYWRYFMWNFAGRQNDIQGNGEPNLGNWISGIPVIDNARLGDQSLLPEEYTTGNKGHNVFYMLPLLLGLLGIIWQSLMMHKHYPRRGIEQFWVIFFLFFMTGIAIVLYLNQTPIQPRERDYAFAGSFYAFSIWIGLGIPAISRILIDLFGKVTSKKKEEKQEKAVAYSATVVACAVALFVPLQMVSQTWDDHDRSHRYTTSDFGANYLNSLEPEAIIFTNGDNDTFPLWYAQEVEGLRTDVRVVNLSYLSTDWYANQMRHPFYDAKPLPTLAKATDYAYDKLAYSRVSKNPDTEPVPALQGLARFYAAPDSGLKNPKMYSPVDESAVIERFGLNPNSGDSALVIPYIAPVEMNALASGFGLSKLLSFDAVANSIANNFDRPAYFASTVPGDYYLGLQPYMYSTGVAEMVTPFRNAPASPLATTAYENIVSKYRWGGLDDVRYNRGLYLDETVRRMVSTMRNSMIETAEQLALQGDEPASDFAISWAKEHNLPIPTNRYDMARYMLHLMEEKLPSYVTPMDNLCDVQTVAVYLDLYSKTGNRDDLTHANALLDNALRKYGQLTNYAASLPIGKFNALGNTDLYLIQYMPIMVGYKNYIDVMQRLAGNPDVDLQQIALTNEALDTYYGQNAYQFVFFQDEIGPEELEAEPDNGTYWDKTYAQAAAIMRLNEAAGLKPMEYAKQLLDANGTNIYDVMRFQPTRGE